MAEKEDCIVTQEQRDAVQSVYHELSLMSKEEFAAALQEVESYLNIAEERKKGWTISQYCMLKVLTL